MPGGLVFAVSMRRPNTCRASRGNRSMLPACQSPNNPTKIAVIGSYVPRRCGIATFSADLLGSMRIEAPGTEFWAVAMNDTPLGYAYPAEVQFEIGQRIISDYRAAVDFLNLRAVDVVSLQHE